MDDVFKALADATRRSLLDALFIQDGQTLGELCDRFSMTRFGVMKHLSLLEEAGLVVTKRRGREKLHYLNPVPIRLVHDRWVSKYAEPWAAALSDLKSHLERPITRVFEVYIRTTPDLLWEAMTDPEIRSRYGAGPIATSAWEPGAAYEILDVNGRAPVIQGKLIEVEPPLHLVQTMTAIWSDAARTEGLSRVTWEIQSSGAICHLTVTHDQLRDSGLPEIYDGWPLLLSGLKTWLETGEALDDVPRAKM